MNKFREEEFVKISKMGRSKAELDKMNGILEIVDYTPIRFAVIVEEFYKNDIKLEDCSHKEYARYAEGFMDAYNEVVE